MLFSSHLCHPPTSQSPLDVLSCSTTHRSSGGWQAGVLQLPVRKTPGSDWSSCSSSGFQHKISSESSKQSRKILSHEQREECPHHCSFLWDGERKCSVHKRTRRSLSDSVFVQAVLNYLPVCLKDTQGNFDISSCEPALKSFWPTKAWRSFYEV